ncbi:MAG: hypothetical protein WBD16_15375 [Pyrinomonadaceae bacterium]
MKKKLTWLVLSLFLSTVSVHAQTKTDEPKNIATGVIFGRNHAYMLKAPKGWVMDNQSGVSQGLHAVFYPKGSSWDKGIAVMYTNVMAKANEKQSLEDLVDQDIRRFKQNSPNLKIEEGETLTLEKGKSAVVKKFSSDTNGNYETVAYINESKVAVIIVLTSRSKKDYEASLSAFRELVTSYLFITDNVTIKN